MPEQEEAIRILTEAKARVERGWCQEKFAVNAAGREVDPWSRDACAWCTLGAVHAVASMRVTLEDSPVRRVLIKAISCGQIAVWNDLFGRTQEDVVAAFDRAIELAKEVSYE